jgi:hypothetical protein
MARPLACKHSDCQNRFYKKSDLERYVQNVHEKESMGFIAATLTSKWHRNSVNITLLPVEDFGGTMIVNATLLLEYT